MAKHTPREDQQNLPHTDVKNNRVHAAARQYAKLHDARIAANQSETEAHEKLMEVMTEEGLDCYSYADVDVTINTNKKCKVTIGGQKPKGEADDDQE